jgi:hypothetical protein
MQSVARMLTLLVLCSGLFAVDSPAAAQSERRVIATASCAAADGDLPTVTVTITNDSQLLIHVPYIVSFSSPVAINASGLLGLLQEETPEQQVIDVKDGETAILTAP